MRILRTLAAAQLDGRDEQSRKRKRKRRDVLDLRH